MSEDELPEWYTVIKNCLREYECFDMKMFAENGGPAAYAMLDMKLRQDKTLLKLSDIRTRDAAEHCVEPSNAGAPLPETDTSDTAVRCPACGGTRWSYNSPNFLSCADCTRAHPNNPF